MDHDHPHDPGGMEQTALTTFSLALSRKCRTVEVLGSWDNFERPYKMRRDTARGSGMWTGCHTFDNIIFDGDRLDWSKPRTGPLKQGGQYWYLYRLDDVDEHCDPAQPTARDCPLLPGQTLNYLEVPREVTEEAMAMTNEPCDRFKHTYAIFPSFQNATPAPPPKKPLEDGRPRTPDKRSAFERFTKLRLTSSPRQPLGSTPMRSPSDCYMFAVFAASSPTTPSRRPASRNGRKISSRPAPANYHQSALPDVLDLYMPSPSSTAETADAPSLATPSLTPGLLPSALCPVNKPKCTNNAHVDSDGNMAALQWQLQGLVTAHHNETAIHLPSQRPRSTASIANIPFAPVDTLLDDLQFLGEVIV